MNRILALLLSLVLALPAQAFDLQGLYEQALTASRQGDFVEALPLWDRFLEQAPELLPRSIRQRMRVYLKES